MAFMILGFGICYKHTTPLALVSKFDIEYKQSAHPALRVVYLALRELPASRFFYELFRIIHSSTRVPS